MVSLQSSGRHKAFHREALGAILTGNLFSTKCKQMTEINGDGFTNKKYSYVKIREKLSMQSRTAPLTCFFQEFLS